MTRTGQAQVRRVLLEAAWSYRHGPRVDGALRKRQEARREPSKEIAWKAQHRLHQRYVQLAATVTRIGTVSVSMDAGATWSALSWPYPGVIPSHLAIAAASPRNILATVDDDHHKVTTDIGANWTPLTMRPVPPRPSAGRIAPWETMVHIADDTLTDGEFYLVDAVAGASYGGTAHGASWTSAARPWCESGQPCVPLPSGGRVSLRAMPSVAGKVYLGLDDATSAGHHAGAVMGGLFRLTDGRATFARFVGMSRARLFEFGLPPRTGGTPALHLLGVVDGQPALPNGLGLGIYRSIAARRGPRSPTPASAARAESADPRTPGQPADPGSRVRPHRGSRRLDRRPLNASRSLARRRYCHART